MKARNGKLYAIIPALFVIMSAMISGIMDISPASADDRYASIYIVTDKRCGDAHSKGIGLVDQVIDYLDQSGVVSHNKRGEKVRYYKGDLGKNWETNDVGNRNNVDSMLDDLIQDFGFYANKKGKVVIGFTATSMNHNGKTRWSDYHNYPGGVCVVSYTTDWLVWNHPDRNVALHELSHALGRLSEGEHDHVDEYKWSGPYCTMNYAYLGKDFKLCWDCKNSIRIEANSWKVDPAYSDPDPWY